MPPREGILHCVRYGVFLLLQWLGGTMPDDDLRQIHEQLRRSQNRYTYFLLAAAASAIALILRSTSDSNYSWSMVPLGLAIVCWGISFFVGCRHIQYVNSTLYANYNYLLVKMGIHPEVGENVSRVSAVSQGIKEAMEDNSEKANKLSRRQFQFLVLGAFFFIIWHLIEMLNRSLNSIEAIHF